MGKASSGRSAGATAGSGAAPAVAGSGASASRGASASGVTASGVAATSGATEAAGSGAPPGAAGSEAGATASGARGSGAPPAAAGSGAPRSGAPPATAGSGEAASSATGSGEAASGATTRGYETMGGGAAFSSQAGTAASLGSIEASSGRSTMEGQVKAGQAAARRAWKNVTGHAWKGTQSTASAGETNHAEPPFVVPEGMDPNTYFELKIKLVGNRKKARKEVRCWSLEKFVDSDLINIKDLVESIVVVCPPSYLEVVHLQYYDNVMKTFPEVTCDQDLMSMFAKHKATKVVTMFIQYCDPSEPYVPITEWEIDEQMQQDNNTKLDDDDYLRNPLPENEHVGVDDEAIYLEDEAANPFFVVVYSEKEQDKDFVPEDDSEDGSEDEDVSDMEIDEDEELVGHEATHIPSFEYDKEDPPMTEGSTYRTMNEFKLALCTHAVKHEFEFKTEKSSQHRFRAYCRRRDLDKCPWKIFASTTYDQCTVKVRKNRCGHECSSTRRKKKVKNATKHWICEKVKDFLIDDATLRARALQKKIKERYGVHNHYKRVYMGRILALNQLYGDWDTSFDNLYRFKEQIESCSPGSIVNIGHYTINGKIRFRRMFFALKPCIDGFLNGCRPYLAVDSTFLTRRFKGQLATASAVDGHNWLYPVCFGVFDLETNDNWNWFMTQLRDSWNPYLFEKHWNAMEKEKPAATNYLRQFHTRLWTRSQFSPFCKVDYVTNNLAECLNNWLKHFKSLNLDDLMDNIRQLLMIKWNQRRKLAKKWDGRVVPHIIKKLNEQTRELSLEVGECSEQVAEVTAMGGSGFRFVVNLAERTCSCRKWQVCGIPCKHALAFITSLPNASIEDYVHEFYSIDRFRAAYHELIPAMPDKSQWPKSTHGFHLYPPLLKSTAGRPRTERYKGCSENKKKKGMHQCPICKDYGHHWHRCKKGNPEDIAAMMAIRGPPKKKAKTTKSAQSSIVPTEDDAPVASMSFPPSQTLETTCKKKGKHVTSGSGGSKCQSLETTSKTKESHDNSNSGPSKRRMSRSGSNQPEPNAIDKPPLKKAKPTRKKKDTPKVIPMLPFDSPAMGTRSKRVDPASPAMSTRSKRRLSL